MKVGILGGTGNISTSFLPLLQQLGHEVTCINRGQRVAGDALPKGVRHLQADRADEKAFEAAMQHEQFEYVIDMICFNEAQAQSSLRAFATPKLKHFIHCSTVCTYGVDEDSLPITESSPLHPISDYGRNKAKADHTFLQAFHQRGIPVSIIKPSTTFGPRMGVLRQVSRDPSWIDRIRQGKPLVVSSDGLTFHQFLHVEDAAPAFCFMLGRERCLGQIYNMTTATPITWRDYHKTIMRVLGSEAPLVGISRDILLREPLPMSDTFKSIFAFHTYYDASKLRHDVPEFNPKISMEEGLARVLKAMEDQGRVTKCEDGGWEDKLIEKYGAK